LAVITNHLSQPPPVTKVESHFNQDEFRSPPPAPARRVPSPIISSESSSDTEIEAPIVNHSHSISPTPSPTFDRPRKQSISDSSRSSATNDTVERHSIDHNRPPARLEKYSPPISASPERPIKSKEETNENDELSFFD
jgi:hypothetical protein